MPLLKHAVLEDVELDKILRKADGFSDKGEDEDAAKVIETEAIPAADRALAAANGLHPSSAWGSVRSTELTELVRARRDSLPAYVASLRGEDLQAKLDSTQTQIALEQAALLVLAHVNGELEGSALPVLPSIPAVPVAAAVPDAAPPVTADASALTPVPPDAHL